ncbi:ribosomal protein bL36 [Candidatus Gromoviella agglomerans]|nr:ribosomal protein bL36 [Candidatus Gromoviella agglomerans]
MQVCSSLKSKLLRHSGCILVRRKGKLRVINKKYPRYKARQG